MNVEIPNTVNADWTPRARDLPNLIELCRAAGDPLRMRILRVLEKEAYSVQELCQMLGRSQPALSHHLRALLKAGLLTARREGTFMFYHRRCRASQASLEELQQALFDALDRHPLDAGLAAKRERARRRRERLSRQFFETHAQRFGAHRDLVAAFDIYADVVQQMLDDVSERRHALEIGPGDGAFLPMLCRRFERVTALDNSPKMLAEARAFSKNQGLHNAHFILGDTSSARMPRGINAATMNMMLHHAAVPAEIIEDVAASLAPGGVLLITELCAHNQDWVREACGDLWLGFEPAQLDDWARAAKLTVGRSEYLGQRNGFCIQVREFYRPSAETVPIAYHARKNAS